MIAIKKPKNTLPARTRKGVRRRGANLSLAAMAVPGLICLLLVNGSIRCLRILSFSLSRKTRCG